MLQMGQYKDLITEIRTWLYKHKRYEFIIFFPQKIDIHCIMYNEFGINKCIPQPLKQSEWFSIKITL